MDAVSNPIVGSTVSRLLAARGVHRGFVISPFPKELMHMLHCRTYQMACRLDVTVPERVVGFARITPAHNSKCAVGVSWRGRHRARPGVCAGTPGKCGAIGATGGGSRAGVFRFWDFSRPISLEIYFKIYIYFFINAKINCFLHFTKGNTGFR